ncbi:hypothetical protein POM88_020455 [Heracleum sosnowskyi]|uniref:TTF-type domain-containing protein n=1 Tax=Heracleum sosnowskyi TaxID=360622 RepID=A0AAD8IF30_9APIA|nr:hypothetical protein POM88_020455 [Heracleum sosnowskyi]
MFLQQYILSEIDLASLERDPGLRRPIWKYPPNVRDDIRKEYIRLGAYQPQLRKDQYPPTEFGNQRRRFQASWFNTFKWLEYSIAKDAAFCFPCYLFENDASSQHAFTIDGFKSWKRVNDNERCAFLVHIGGSYSPHKKAIKSLKGLKNVTRHIDKVINCQSLEEVRNKIRNEVGDSKFCILVDEAIDASQKEQMAIVLRFVDVYGVIRERFFYIVNVIDTTSSTLKKELSNVLTRNNLSIQNMRALVGAAEKQDYVWKFFSMLANVVNIVTGSSKRLSELQTTHGIEVDHSVASGECETGRGLNQIGNLQRAGSTRFALPSFTK